MKLKKVNAATALLSTLLLFLHIGYSAYAYLTFYYNPQFKILTAYPFMILACIHAVCGMSSLFMQGDGTRLDLYPKQNFRTILQRLSAALIFPLLILHINTYSLLKSSSENGQIFFFFLLIIVQILFYAVAITHAAVSFSRALITLGWLASRERQKTLDKIVYVFCAIVFAVTAYAVVRTQLVMFLYT